DMAEFVELYNPTGVAQAEAGQRGEAERLFRLALMGDGACGAALVGLGQQREALGKPEEAETLYRRAMDAGRDTVEACLALATLKQSQKQTGVADVLREAAGLAAREPADLMRVGKAMLSAGQSRAAATLFARVLRLEPGDREARRDLIVALAGEGDIEEALTHLARTARDLPDDPWPHAMAGDLHARAGRPDRAVAALQNALRRDAGHVDARTTLAAVLGRAGRWAEAVAHFTGVLMHAPDALAARRGLAELLAARGFEDLAAPLRSDQMPDTAGMSTEPMPEPVAAVIGKIPVLAGKDGSRPLPETIHWLQQPIESLNGLGVRCWRVTIGALDLQMVQPSDPQGSLKRWAAMAGLVGKAGAMGLTAPLVYADSTSRALVTLMLPGGSLVRANLANRSATERVAQALQKLHRASTLEGLSDQSILGTMEGLERRIPESLVEEQFASLKDVGRRVRTVLRALPEQPATPCLGIEEPSALADTGQTVFVAEWSLAAKGDPALDVAAAINAASLGPEPEAALIAAYVGGANPAQEHRIRLLRLVEQYVRTLRLIAGALGEDGVSDEVGLRRA
ncbi:MAG: tetratricopeptide repeat protein, partial [Rhodospirillaceae bacterium]